MQPDLPETYYLDNVLILFEHVSRVYDDLLADELREFLATFDQLDSDAQKLHIRLLNRSQDLYRESKLKYAEIDDIPGAIERLAERGCIALAQDLEPADLLALFTKPELLAAAGQADLARLKRDQLEAHLIDAADAEYFSALSQQDRFLQLLQRDSYSLSLIHI